MHSRRHPFAALVPMLIAALCAAAHGNTFTNPVVPRGGDPWAFQFGGQYFYSSTTGGDVKVARSPWLQSLNSNSRQIWNPPTNTAYGNNIWAPEIHRLNDKWYLYVAADDGADANHRMFVLEGDSQDPQGSYTLKGQISVPSNRWAIDGTVFEHGDKDYFIWSGRRYSSGGSDFDNDQSLYIAEMSNPWTLSGSRVAISHPTLSWERNGHPVNEGPQILKNGSDVFLTYSASGFYTPQYAIGALKLNATNPLSASAWTKHNQPLFDGASGSGVEGTGHASFVKSPDGTQDWIVYHARTTNDAPRDVRIQPFTFGGANGLPQFGEPLPTGQVTPVPSGVPLVTFIPNLSFERGGTGWLDDFRAFGDAGAIDNDGSRFATIAGGDGPRVGYLGADNSGIYQDIGPLHAGEYTLSL
ncbi:MAG: glycoside hydrolase family 43 protein, partial [Planctomycetota bacterium]|nr:glycoside hydrolase family 43 protein [Planctomycetota bacterium]